MAEVIQNYKECKKVTLAVRDAMDVLNGKWKVPLIAALSFGKLKYSQLLRELNGISGKMLSRELKELEIQQLIKRIVQNTKPLSVEYELTEHGKKLRPVIQNLSNWGFEHRKKIMGK
jgi:DNA-binding HxlR family transcriptional regulator